MAYLGQLLVNVYRIVLLRGSPERIHYTRTLFIAVLLLAIAASAVVQASFFGDHLVFVILRVFAEVTMFMMMMVMLTARIPRFRLARMMLALVLISLSADMLLIVMSPLPLRNLVQPAVAGFIAYVVGALAIYGAGNCVAWGLRSSLAGGLGVIGLYVAAAVGLDLGFRGLYGIVAAG